MTGTAIAELHRQSILAGRKKVPCTSDAPRRRFRISILGGSPALTMVRQSWHHPLVSKRFFMIELDDTFQVATEATPREEQVDAALANAEANKQDTILLSPL